MFRRLVQSVTDDIGLTSASERRQRAQALIFLHALEAAHELMRYRLSYGKFIDYGISSELTGGDPMIDGFVGHARVVLVSGRIKEQWGSLHREVWVFVSETVDTGEQLNYANTKWRAFLKELENERVKFAVGELFILSECYPSRIVASVSDSFHELEKGNDSEWRTSFGKMQRQG